MLSYLGVCLAQFVAAVRQCSAAAAARFTHTGVGPLAAEITGVNSAGEDPETLPTPCSAAVLISQVA